MKTLLIALAVGAALGSGLAQAQPGADVLKTKGCLGCHDVDKKKVGPAFKDIAAKYKGDRAQAAPLAAKIKEGKGHPKSAASEAELKAAVEQVLATQ
jgi:cytochrome c